MFIVEMFSFENSIEKKWNKTEIVEKLMGILSFVCFVHFFICKQIPDYDNGVCGHMISKTKNKDK